MQTTRKMIQVCIVGFNVTIIFKSTADANILDLNGSDPKTIASDACITSILALKVPIRF